MTDNQLNHTMIGANEPIKTVYALKLLALVKSFVKLNDYFKAKQRTDRFALNMITIDSLRLWVLVLHLPSD